MINKIDDRTMQAIIRKTPYAHSTRPSDDGMPAEQVKKMFYTAIVDEDNSVLAEMERMRQEANRDIAAKADVSDITDDPEADCDSRHIPSALGLVSYQQKTGNIFRLYFTDLTVSAAQWQALDEPMGTYGYAATLSLPRVTAAMVPDLYFSPTDAVRPELATFCHCLDGAIRVYATRALEVSVYIPCLVCSLPAFFCVTIASPDATVTVQDDAGKTYAHGDYVAVGAHLTVRVLPPDGYALQQVTVCGQSYSGESVCATIQSVQGTVAVAAVCVAQGGGV